MVELNFKKPYVEPIAPNQDAVKDAVNPLGGLQDISVAIRQSTEMLDKLRQANVYGDANTQFTSLSAETNTDFMNYTNSLDMRHTREEGEKINTYINNTLRKKYDNFLSKIPDREVRQKFAMQKEHDLRSYQQQGLYIQRGAVTLAQSENITIAEGLSATKVLQDPSNENYFRQVQNITDHINSLPIGLVEKQKLLNQAQDKLHINQIIGAYKNNPRTFEGFITASYKGGSTPKDPTSIADVMDSASERSLEVNTDVNKAIGLAGWDRLDDSKRRPLLEHLISGDNATNTKLRNATKARVRLIDANLNQGNVLKESELISLEDYTQAYGVEQGAELYDLQQFKLAIAPDVARIKLMPDLEAKEFLQKVATHASDPTFSLETTTKFAKYHQMLSKAHTDSMTELHADSIKWGIKHQQIDPLRFDTAENFAQSVAQRSSFVKSGKEKYGIEGCYFNSDDEKLLKDQLMRRPAHESVQMYNQAYQQSSDGDKESVLSSFTKIKDNAVSAVAQLSSEYSSEANVAAHHTAVGAKNKEDIDRAYKASKGDTSFDKDFNSTISKSKEINKFLSTSDYYSRGETLDAMGYYIRGKMHAIKDYRLDRKRVEEAFKAVLGNTPVYSGTGESLILPPRGMDHKDFKNRLWIATDKVLRGDKNRATNPYWYDHVDMGSGRYGLIYQGKEVKDKGGKSIIVNVNDVPKEDLQISKSGIS